MLGHAMSEHGGVVTGVVVRRSRSIRIGTW